MGFLGPILKQTLDNMSSFHPIARHFAVRSTRYQTETVCTHQDVGGRRRAEGAPAPGAKGLNTELHLLHHIMYRRATCIVSTCLHCWHTRYHQVSPTRRCIFLSAQVREECVIPSCRLTSLPGPGASLDHPGHSSIRTSCTPRPISPCCT